MDQKNSPDNPPKDKEGISRLIGSKIDSAIHTFETRPDEKANGENDFLIQSKKREHNSLSWVYTLFVWVIGFTFIFVTFSRIIHFVLPEEGAIGVMPFCSWLTKEQIQEIDKVLFSGSIGGILVGYFKNKVANK